MSDETMRDQTARVKREAAAVRTYIRDSMKAGRPIFEIRLRLALEVSAGRADPVVLISALVDEIRARVARRSTILWLSVDTARSLENVGTCESDADIL